MNRYSSEALRDAIDALRGALVRLARVRDEIDPDEPVRDRITREAAVIDQALDELELVYDDARYELL